MTPAEMLPDTHPLRSSHTLTLEQVAAIIAADSLRASTDMQVGKPTQRNRVAHSLLLKG